MNKKKYIIFRFTTVIIILICLFIACSGCSQEGQAVFYSLEEAYKLNIITKEDLSAIAHYHNNAIEFPQALSAETENAIKETACRRLRDEHGIEDVSIDGIKIEEYCGAYNEYYAVVLSDIYILTPTNVPQYTKEIDGIEFNYTGYGIIEIWCAQSI